jgi:hypothetical protein
MKKLFSLLLLTATLLTVSVPLFGDGIPMPPPKCPNGAKKC